MVTVSAVLIAAVARSLSPVTQDLYKNAKGKVKESLKILSVLNGTKKLARSLLKIEYVKTIWSPEKELSILEFYYPSKIFCKEINNAEVVKLGQLPEGNLVIQGIVGQGKSIFLRYLASAAIRDESSCLIPVFLELRTLSKNKNIEQSVGIFFDSIGIEYSKELFSYMASSGKLILLLDGFDEIVSEVLSQTLEEIEFLQVKYPEMRIIVSSRPGNNIQMVSGFSVVSLSVLGAKDYDSFLKRLKISTVKRVELIGAISESSSSVGGVITTPLMMTLVVLVYEAEREIPPTLPEFFEKMFHIVFTRHDRLKLGFSRQHYSGLSERKLQQLFESFCFMVMQSGHGRSLTGEEFNDAFDLAIEYVEDCNCEVDDFKKDIVKVACLMLEDGFDDYSFLHKSILEYYAAAFIKHSSSEVAELFYKEAGFGSFSMWSDVLRFLSAIDGYRYAKNYILQGGPDFLVRIEGLLKNRKDNELLNFILSSSPEIGIEFEEDATPISFGPIGKPEDPWVMYTDNFFMDALFSVVKSKADSILVRRAIKGSIDGVIMHYGDSGYNLHLRDIFKIFGAKVFWDKLQEADLALREMITSAKVIVDAQDKRKAIFGKKTPIKA